MQLRRPSGTAVDDQFVKTIVRNVISGQ